MAWASESIATRTPSSLHMRQYVSTRSRRSGGAFTSRCTPRAFAARTTCSMSTSYGSRAQDARGLSRAAQVELAVHGGDDDVEPSKRVVGQIEAAVLEDVDLDAA